MRELWKLAWKLLLIAAVAGLALGSTNAMTQAPIQGRIETSANAARGSVLPAATDFKLLSEGEGGCDDTYSGLADGETVGYTARVTARGYGGEIEVIVGTDMQGVVTGVNVGGVDFAETAGLGIKTKDAAFRDQFVGKKGPFVISKTAGEIGEPIDAVSGTTISSSAVVSAVNTACERLLGLIG